jgi:hypothetical protein
MTMMRMRAVRWPRIQPVARVRTAVRTKYAITTVAPEHGTTQPPPEADLIRLARHARGLSPEEAAE